MPDAPSYAASLARALAGAMLASLVVGLLDGVGAVGSHGPRAVIVVLALYLIPAIVLAVVAGFVLGAADATFGAQPLRRALARLKNDAATDRTVCAWVIASAVTGLLFAAFIALGSLSLVGGVQRKEVGAILFGVIALAALPSFFLLSLPVHRGALKLARLVPRVGPLPATIVLVGVGSIALTFGVLSYAGSSLDTKALSLGFVFHAVLFFVIFKGWIAASSTVLSARLRRIPRFESAVFAAAALTFAGSLVLIRGPLSGEANAALEKQGGLSQLLLASARRVADRDGDGYSALLGGPDCDDGNPDVNPGPDTIDIPGNGIDENCFEGDASPPDPDADKPEVVSAAQKNVVDKIRPSEANLLFIAVDTVRADRLGIRGYKRDGRSLTPTVDALASSGAHFSRAYAQAPNTPRSFPSFFSSRLPSQVAVDKPFKNYSVVLPENVTLWEAMQEAGIRTIGYSSHFYFKEERGIRQGFDEYDNEGAKDIAGSNKDIASPRTVPKVLARLGQLAESKQRFAMFVHLFEPHSTYMKHDAYPINTRGVQSLIQKYDYEILFTDGWLNKLLVGLEETGLSANTIVVLLSDHGEAFGVHRVGGKKMFFHGQTLYDELLRVPLIIKVPGAEPVDIKQPVMLIDVAPTILDILGVERPPSFEGRTLLPAIAKTELSQRPVYGELIPAPSWNRAAKMVVSGDGRYKLIYQTTEKRYELYDLDSDPEERENLFKSAPELASPLRKILSRWIETGKP